MSVAVWIKAARLRTLPLAIAGAITGNLIAMSETGSLNKTTFLLSVLTAILLQILSNYANDYGDFKNGADTNERTDRMMATGQINEKNMKTAISILILMVLISGIILLLKSIGSFNLVFLGMLVLGIAGIMAAFYYTAGKNPYGYIGLGDLSVFIFFGFIAVTGTYFLQTGTLYSDVWWVGAGVGLLSTGVLNINNIRDMQSDQLKNKITIPVMLGYQKSLVYHALLLTGAIVCFSIYVYVKFEHPLQLLYLILIPLFIKHFYNVKKAIQSDRIAYNKQLKYLSLLTLLFSIIFCSCQLIIQ